MFKNIHKVHFVGIGGIGMSGLAEILLSQGFEVSGSDKALSEVTEHLTKLGIKVYEGHSPDNLKDADVLVYSSAVTIDNAEVKAAIDRKIPVIKRAEMLAESMRMKYGIGIAGTHGKTTTTSMVGLTLTEGNIDPTIIVGGKLSGLGGTNATVTDAWVALGYIDPNYFLGGRRKLDAAKSRAVIKERVADPLKMTVEQAADAMVKKMNTQSAQSVKDFITAKGVKVEDVSMFGFGGAGGLASAGIAQAAGVSKI